MAKRREDERSRGEQLGLTLLLWSIPVCLFGYLAWNVAEATGNDPRAFLPPIEPWQLVLGAVAVLLIVAAVAVWRSGAGRASTKRADDPTGRTV